MSEAVRTDEPVPGLTVVSEHLPWCHGVAVGVWIAAGSADEGPGEHGAAHFLEHVLFKRTAHRTGLEISQSVDLVGGDLNAYTGREHTCYHVHVPAEALTEAVGVLLDVVACGTCDPADIELERDVVLDELAARGDDTEDLACDLATEAVLGSDPLGRPVIGTEESVRDLDADVLRRVHSRSLRAGGVVVAAAGRVDHDELVRLVADGPLGAALTHDGARGPRDAGRWATGPVLVGEDDDAEQTQVVLARRSPARAHPDRAAAQVATAVLGGGLSSRLFQRVREERGLAYSVYAGLEQFTSTGVLTVVAGCPAERADELTDALAGVLEEFSAMPPDAAEVSRAVGHLTGSIRLSLDDPMSRMTRIGRHVLDRGAVVPVETSLRRLRAVTADDVARYWAGERAPWGLAVVGPGGAGPARGGAARLLDRLGR